MLNDRVFELRCGKIWLAEDGIVHQEFVSHAELTLRDAEDVLAVCRSLWTGRKILVYMDTRGVKSISREVRGFVADRFAEYTAAVAITGTPIIRVASELLVKLNRPAYPIRVFTSAPEALEWLRSLLK